MNCPWPGPGRPMRWAVWAGPWDWPRRSGGSSPVCCNSGPRVGAPPGRGPRCAAPGARELAETVRKQLSGLLQLWDAGGDPTRLVTPVCRTLGQRVRVELPGGADVVGRAVALAQDGALVVRSEGHQEHVVRAGD